MTNFFVLKWLSILFLHQQITVCQNINLQCAPGTNRKMKNITTQIISQTKQISISLLWIAVFNITSAKLAIAVSTLLRGEVIKESGIPPYRLKTVVIDAGHGGHDPGCSGSSSREKHITLAVAIQLAATLKKEHPDLRIILTRDTDVFIPLHERAAIANRNQADLFISIHCNFMPGKSSVLGSETYVMGLHTMDHNLEVAKRENEAILLEENYRENYDYDPDSPEGHIALTMFQSAYLEQSIRFAALVEQQFAAAGRRSRGVRQAGFVVLKASAMPSALIEIGYLSNKSEEDFLKSDYGQTAITGAISEAFRAYRSQIEGQSLSAESITDVPGGTYIAKNQQNEVPYPQHTAFSVPAENLQVTSHAAPPSPSSSEVQFCIQLSAAASPEDFNTTLWKNFPFNVDEVREDGKFKYQIRNMASYDHAHQTRLKVLRQGFPGAFIVAYKNGKRISVEEALRESK